MNIIPALLIISSVENGYEHYSTGGRKSKRGCGKRGLRSMRMAEKRIGFSTLVIE
jgi:hypothetical protein